MPRIDLLSPITFRNGAHASNRVALAPMTNKQSEADGALADAELHFLERRAEGGFGIVTTCASHVTRDGQGWEGELGIYDDALLPGLTRLASSLRSRGALSLVQIFHGGARSPKELIGEQPWSASEIAGDPAAPRAATVADIERVIAAFRDAAVRAHRAGFDGVELHGAHGYLLCQFLSRTMNTRTDAWGGALEGRARLMREVTRAVRAAVPASFVVGARISPEDFGNAKGMDLDESLTLAKWLAEDGVDYLHISLWNAFQNTQKRPAEHAITLFREALPKELPLFVAGKVWSRAEADALIDLGADVIALGRAAVANADWPKKAASAAFESKKPPFTAAELRAEGLSDGFVDYMRNWKGFVTG